MHPLDLFDPVSAGQGGEYRLIESGQEQLDAPVGHQAAQPVEIRRVVLLQPLEERPREVKDYGKKVAAERCSRSGRYTSRT